MLKIFAFTSNRADLIEIQMQSFQKYIQEDFSFTVFNNSKVDRPEQSASIEHVCKKWGVTLIDVKLDADLIARCNTFEKSCTMLNNAGRWSNPNCAGSYACVYVWEKYISKEKGPICLIHPDVFFDRPVKLTDYLKITPLRFNAQSSPGLGGIYMADCMVLADMDRLPNPETINWMGSLVNGINTDGGGHTFFYLQEHPEFVPTIHRRYIEYDPAVDFQPSDYEIFSIENAPVAIHYLRGSNWNNRSFDYHVKKTAWLRKRLGLEAA